MRAGWAVGCLLGLTACGSLEVEEVSVGSLLGCARQAEGTVKCWGQGMIEDLVWDTPKEVPDLKDVESIAVGSLSLFATRKDGSVHVFGFNFAGQLGDGTNQDRVVVTEVPQLAGLRGFSGSGFHACAMRPDGRVACWGSNSFGQLGHGTDAGEQCRVSGQDTSCRRTPTEVPGLVGATAVSAESQSATCARMGDGTVQCWGDNRTGALGDGTTTTRHTPRPVSGLRGVAEVSVSGGVVFGGFACARLEDGTVQCWGSNTHGQLGSAASAQTCKDLFSQDKPCSLTPQPVPGLTGVVQLSLGDAFACALKGDGSVTCWGNNGSGELGRGSIGSGTAQLAPVTGLGAASQISAGNNSACARLTDATLWCWGGNEGRQVGSGQEHQPKPVQLD
jgi:alpha-tubulin suppressor-like RCC1 family protein